VDVAIYTNFARSFAFFCTRLARSPGLGFGNVGQQYNLSVDRFYHVNDARAESVAMAVLVLVLRQAKRGAFLTKARVKQVKRVNRIECD